MADSELGLCLLHRCARTSDLREMSSGQSDARAPLLSHGSVNSNIGDTQDKQHDTSRPHSACSDENTASHNQERQESDHSRAISARSTSDNEVTTSAGGKQRERMKYRRFRTPVNFVMFRTPTLRTEATQINTINGMW